MKILLYLCLMCTTCAVPLRKPRKAGFGSKSEEMMQFGPYGYMNSPHLTASLYGYRPSFLQPFLQQQMLPQRVYLWQQQTPVHQVVRGPQHKPHQTPVAKQANSRPQPRRQLPQQPQRPQLPQQPQRPRPQVPLRPQKPIWQRPPPKTQQPPKPPQNTNPMGPSQTHQQVPVQQPKEEKKQKPQAFPPYYQQPWNFPQIFGQGGFQRQPFGPFQRYMPGAFGGPRPPNSEEGAPYFGYGYPGLGGRPPYNSEELEQDFEPPKEKEAPKESPAADPATNATASDTNSTISNVLGQGGNATVSGLSTPGNEASFQGLESNLLSGNGLSTPLPTAHVSGGDGAVQNGINQSNHRANPPNAHLIQSFPSGNQQSIGHDSYLYRPHPGMGDIRHNTLIPRRNPSEQTENPTYPLRYGENSNQRSTLWRTNSHHPSVNTRPNPSGQQEQIYYPEKNPSGQTERVPFTSSGPQHQWNEDPVYGNGSPPESYFLDPQFNKAGVENVHHGREETGPFQPSGKHLSSSLPHQGVFSATRKTPSETEIHPYDGTKQPFNPAEREREQLSSPQNQRWNNQKGSLVFQEDRPRYNSMFSSDSFGPKGHMPFSEKDPYDQRSHPFYPSAWEDRENSPTRGPAGQRERPTYSPVLPSNQMQRNSYHRSDSFLQQGHEYPRQNPLSHEKRLLDLDRPYRNPPYNPPQHHAYPKYSIVNPAKQRGNSRYEETDPWAPEESPPVYGAEEHLGQTENSPYPMNRFRHRERDLQNQRSNSPQHSTNLLPGGSQYPEKDPWGSQVVSSSTKKDISPYTNTYSADFRRNPAHNEDTGGTVHGNGHISSFDVAERRHSDTLAYSDDYPREHRTMTPCHTVSDLCCGIDSPVPRGSAVPRENLLAPMRSAPQFRLASWEQRSSAYPDSSHSKHARHVPYPAGFHSSQGSVTSLNAEEDPPNQKENLVAFGEEVAGAERNTPCFKSHLGQQNGRDVNHETKFPPAMKDPCYGSSIRGDRHNIPALIMETSPGKRELEWEASAKLTPEKLPPPQGMKSEAFGSEDDRKEQYARFGFEKIPCFGSRLKQYLLSSTGAPPGDKQHNLFYAENPPMPTGKPDAVPPEPQPISSTNPSHNVDGKLPKSSSPREELADQPNERLPDCLLLQNK